MISGLVGAVGLGAIVPGLAFASTGAQSVASVGSVSVGSGVVKELTGAATQGQVGSVSADVAVAASGVVASSDIGPLYASLALQSVSVSASVGSVYGLVRHQLIGATIQHYTGSIAPSGGTSPAPSVMMAYEVKAEPLRYKFAADGMAYEVKAANITYRIEV